MTGSNGDHVGGNWDPIGSDLEHTGSDRDHTGGDWEQPLRRRRSSEAAPAQVGAALGSGGARGWLRAEGAAGGCGGFVVPCGRRVRPGVRALRERLPAVSFPLLPRQEPVPEQRWLVPAAVGRTEVAAPSADAALGPPPSSAAASPGSGRRRRSRARTDAPPMAPLLRHGRPAGGSGPGLLPAPTNQRARTTTDGSTAQSERGAGSAHGTEPPPFPRTPPFLGNLGCGLFLALGPARAGGHGAAAALNRPELRVTGAECAGNCGSLE
ncbi:uncharacterized protein LOC116436929 [Corvus moneduloides]|uniref:uncharacterized protein LOC116436929 n=1 Tax=Corvus moneduloides TaxID=1196302 RepID=UPI00136328C5|nr:uncharacterized protein LOC116436929 [Corvus moneduloides]